MPTIEAKKVISKKKGTKDTEAIYEQEASDQVRIPKNITISGLKAKLKAEKDEDIRYQSRRWGQWEENYLLYRDTVELNRLTQPRLIVTGKQIGRAHV